MATVNRQAPGNIEEDNLALELGVLNCYANNMNRRLILLLAAFVIVITGSAYFVYQKNSKEAATGSSQKVGMGYNPNYANAIQQNRPELCQDIEYALIGRENDDIDRVYGNEAVKTCEDQAKAGLFECECDSEAVLNSMRNR